MLGGKLFIPGRKLQIAQQNNLYTDILHSQKESGYFMNDF